MILPPTIRLWIEYALIALVIIAAGLSVTLKMQLLRQEVHIEKLSGEVESTKSRLTTIEEVNEAQRGVIQDLSDLRKEDGSSILRLMTSYEQLSLADKKLRAKLSNLENNDEARTFLDDPVPASVGCLWDDSCEAPATGKAPGDTGGASANTAGAVLPPPEGKAPDKP